MADGKLGRNEKLVLDALAESGRTMSAYDILDAVRGSGVRAPAQVYRALDKLCQRHLVHRIESMNAFVACAHEHDDEPADPEHLPEHEVVGFCICEDCGDVAELPLDSRLTRLDALTGSTGFEARELTFEVKGLCKDCCRAH